MNRDAGLDAISLLVEIRDLLVRIDAKLGLDSIKSSDSDATLLAEISAAIGSEPFTVAALLADADPALAAAVIESTGELDAGTNKRVGHLLSKAARSQSLVGFRVERIDTAEGVTVWRVSGV